MGGSKKSSGTVTADNLFNQDIVELLLGIGEGTIYGLKNGLVGFYANSIPIISETGEKNFQDLAISLKQGYNDDLPVTYLTGGEGSILSEASGVTLPASITRSVVTPPQYRGLIHYIDIRLLISQLYSGDGKNVNNSSIILSISYRKVGTDDWRYVTNTSSTLYEYKKKVETLRQAAADKGLDYDTMTEEEQAVFELKTLATLGNITAQDLVDATAQANAAAGGTASSTAILQTLIANNTVSHWTSYANQLNIDVSTTEGAATLMSHLGKTIAITGKTTSGYIYELSIPIFDESDSEDDWEVRIIRMSRELTSDEKKYSGKTISIESISVIGDKTKSYPKTATCQIVAQHTDRFDDIPDFSAEIMGLMCEVPTNYNPFTKTFDGIWDGNFKRAWTDNNALIARELIMNRDWGKRASETRLQVDNTSLLEAIRYCDDQVPDLYGNLKPRHTFNEILNSKKDIDTYLKYVLGSFHATYREMFGVFYFFIDRKKDPTFFVSLQTILQTGFSYYRTDLESRYNMIRVSFNNASNNYEEDRRVVNDAASQTANGLIPYSFSAVGATNVSEAIRQAVYLMYTNKDEVTLCNFSQPRLGHVVNLYDHFYIFDPDLDWGTSARISSYNATNHTIGLRDPLVQLTTNTNYKVWFHTPTGLEYCTAKSLDDYTLELTDSTKFADCDLYLAEETPIGIEGGVYGSPTEFRVLSIEQSDSNDVAQGELFTFKTAIVVNRKYDAIDNINDSSLVDFSFNNTDLTYSRDTIPTAPYNLKLWLNPITDASGNYTYGISFSADVVAAYYILTWTDPSSNATHTTRLYDTAGTLSPAFSSATTVNLAITPVTRKGVVCQTIYLTGVRVGLSVQGALPKLIDVVYNTTTKTVDYSFTAADFASYTTDKYLKATISVTTPQMTQTGLPIALDATSYSVPYVGAGLYRIAITFEALASDNDGFTDSVTTSAWSYTGDDNGATVVSKYPAPVLNSVTAYRLKRLTSTSSNASADHVYLELVVSIPNLANYPMLTKKLNDATNYPNFSPFVIITSDYNNNVFRRIGFNHVISQVSGQTAGTFKINLEAPATGSFTGDETKTNGLLKIKVVDHEGDITDEQLTDWICNSLDSAWVSHTIPEPTDGGFKPSSVYIAYLTAAR